MRSLLRLALAATLCLYRSAADAGDAAGQVDTPSLSSLELQWQDCLRQAYAGQPAGQSRAAAQRSALDACKEQEDAFVTAILASQIAEEEVRWRREQRSVASRARAWAASVSAYVFDPVTTWLSRWTR
ncbi:hypothetical protein [Methylobacterium nigriterrae]|uniref:hypothetical protein n=1 Tax=Methylobacterium nigriterrae TaxID=3127512 RepID=UPI003013AFE3